MKITKRTMIAAQRTISAGYTELSITGRLGKHSYLFGTVPLEEVLELPVGTYYTPAMDWKTKRNPLLADGRIGYQQMMQRFSRD